MDKSWLSLSRFSEEYRNGAKTFVNKAKESAGNVDYIICPCEKCRNLRYQHVDIVYEHLVITGMNPAYDTWVFHGENPNMHVHNEDAQVSDTYRMYRDVYDQVSDTEGESPEKMEEVILQELENVKSPLYPGCTEYTRLSATVLLYKHKSVNDWGKMKKKKRKRRSKTVQMWKKKSIFFDLPYWEGLVLRHNLDVMHIEKNVCDSLLSTLLDIKGKSKDRLKSRKDLKVLKIRHHLYPKRKGKRLCLPAAVHTLSKEEKKTFCKRLFDIKLPDGYGSTIGNCILIDECKIKGLKSHDYHILMQQLLTVALRGLLPKGPRFAIFQLSAYFNELCRRVIDGAKLEEMENDIAETLCMLERFFPPSFFDIMIHLTIHLGREAQRCGPVQYRWMYPFERFMKKLKGYVRNKARPEGCIAECYLAEECMRFCSGYMKCVGALGSRHNRNEDTGDETILGGHPFTAGELIDLSEEELQIAHRYVLYNSAEVDPYIEFWFIFS